MIFEALALVGHLYHAAVLKAWDEAKAICGFSGLQVVRTRTRNKSSQVLKGPIFGCLRPQRKLERSFLSDFIVGLITTWPWNWNVKWWVFLNIHFSIVFPRYSKGECWGLWSFWKLWWQIILGRRGRIQLGVIYDSLKSISIAHCRCSWTFRVFQIIANFIAPKQYRTKNTLFSLAVEIYPLWRKNTFA